MGNNHLEYIQGVHPYDASSYDKIVCKIFHKYHMENVLSNELNEYAYPVQTSSKIASDKCDKSENIKTSQYTLLVKP